MDKERINEAVDQLRNYVDEFSRAGRTDVEEDLDEARGALLGALGAAVIIIGEELTREDT